jgi:hypothetical protein
MFALIAAVTVTILIIIQVIISAHDRVSALQYLPQN